MTRRGRWGRFLRYAATSGLATLISAVTFAVAYRVLHWGPMASLAATATGFAVNFTGSRFWAWSRVQRDSLGRDVTSFAALTVTTALAAAGVTSVAHSYTGRFSLSANQRTVLVEGAYFATYAAMFLVKFMILDRVLFARSPSATATTVELAGGTGAVMPGALRHETAMPETVKPEAAKPGAMRPETVKLATSHADDPLSRKVRQRTPAT